MEIGVLPEQEKIELEDDGSFLERIWNKISNREVLGAGYEIGAGLTFDTVTAPLKLAPPLYAALNFGEGYVSNVIAQKIRGQKWNEIDWNEAMSSGALGVIPLSQLRAAKYLRKPAAQTVEKVVGKAGTLQRNIISGGIIGGGDVTIRSGLEGELPDPAELATGVVGGGALAGTLTPILKRTSKYVNEIVAKRKANTAESELLSKQLEIQEKIKNDPNSITPEDTRALRKAIWNVDKAKGDYGPFDSFEEWEQKSSEFLGSIENKIDGIDPSDAYEQQLKKYWKGQNVEFPVRALDDVPQDIRSTMAWESGLVDGVFDFERWLSKSLYGKYFRSRTTVAKMQAVYGTDVNFRTYADQIILPQFVKEWGPILDKLKIPRSSLQVHHIFALRASAGLYDGLRFGSKEWVDVTNTLLKKYFRTGDMPGNLMPIVGATSDVGTPHYITHRYIDDLIGPTGEKFFTKEVREKMRRNLKYRIKKTEEFAEKMKTAEGIAVQAQKVWDRIWGPGQVIPEELVEDLSELPMTVDPKYRTDVELERLVKQVFSQINEFPFPESMSRKEFIKNWLPQFEGKGFDALRRMFEVDLDLTPQEAMQTPLGYRILKYLQTNEIKVRNPIKKRFKKLNKPK